jgi:hypothetical protein
VLLATIASDTMNKLAWGCESLEPFALEVAARRCERRSMEVIARSADGAATLYPL